MTSILTILFDGIAYGMLLFVLSVGLSVTLGLMNFVNLAHCAFAMLGGYVTATLMNDFHWPFLATLPAAFIAAAAVSVAARTDHKPSPEIAISGNTLRMVVTPCTQPEALMP